MNSDPLQHRPNRRFEFTRREFWRGARAAWVIFMGILVIALVLTAVAESGYPWGPPLSMITLYLLFGIPVGGIIAGLAVLAGAPVAWALGRMLSAIDRILIHIVAFSALGAFTGIAVMALVTLPSAGYGIDVLGQPFAVAVMGACAVSVGGGWAWTVWQAGKEMFPAR
ncbi:hypothetical protein [Microbacterium aurantiacum]|uniref:hypothetical protein n=1 Tax=Microbacterium aurantiacum TaxID=162393 RepID=UPI000C80932B|nr:hypothetical protein [Microbacterium aurantiacum]